MKITHHDLYDFLQARSLDCDGRKGYTRYIEDHGGKISKEAWDYLWGNEHKFKAICVSWAMSENHIGGDDILHFVDLTIEAIKEGWEVITWYGPDTEVLIAGIKEGLERVEITD